MSRPFSDPVGAVGAMRHADALLAGQRRVLELLAKRAPLVEILHHLVFLLEEHYEGLLCSILLVDERSQTFKAGVDVSDAKNYSLEGSGISYLPPYAGPCCRCAHLGERVVSEDIATDTKWNEQWRIWALENGLRSCRSHPIFASTGEVVGTLALYHKSYSDPTLAKLYQVEVATHIAGIAIERKRLEARETEWREKMERLNAELDHSLKLRDEFLSIASHELNSPLATMKMRTAFEKKSVLDGGDFDRARALRLLEGFESQIDRVLSLVRTLTDASCLEHRQQKLNLMPLDLCHVVLEVVNRLRPAFVRSKCTVSLDLEDSIEGIWDQVRIEQVLTNLLTNAEMYGGEGTVSVSARALGPVAQIVVQDRGPGIAPENHEKIFERYERVAPQRATAGGLGLGLYITREIVRAHQGRIRVESALGQGAKFVVELPRGLSS